MKKFITALLVIAMIASFAVPAFAASEVEVVYTSPIFAGADNANTEYISSSVLSNNNLHEGEELGTWVNGQLVSRGNRGDIIDEVTVGEFGALNKNNGDVTTNKGYINDNTKTGVVTTNNDTVKTNNGTVATNDGTVGTNNGTVKVNNDGTVTTNKGTVDTNNGTVTTNSAYVGTNNGTVTTNDGIVIANKGYINDNTKTGVVATNNDTVDTNNGTVTLNKGTVGTNDGVVISNKDTVTVNNGSVVGNDGDVTVNIGNIANSTGKVEVNFGTVEIDSDYILFFPVDQGTVGVNYGTITEGKELNHATDIIIDYDAKNEVMWLNGSEIVNMGTIVDSKGLHTNTYNAVVYTDTEKAEADWTAEQLAALEAAGKLKDANQYDGIQQAVNGTFYVYSAEKAAEMNITKEGYTLVCFEDDEHNVYNFSTKIENVTNPLFLKAVYELIVRSQGAAYVADEFSLATNTATLVMNRKMYTDADLAAREMTVKVNGEEVSHNDFTVSIDENGNILIVFTDAFMATLSAGEHHLQVKFANGVVYNVVIVK